METEDLRMCQQKSKVFFVSEMELTYGRIEKFRFDPRKAHTQH